MIPTLPEAWAERLPQAGAPKARVPVQAPAETPDLATLRQRLADTAKGRQGDGWGAWRRAAVGERMFRIEGGPGDPSLPLVLGVDEFISKKMIHALAGLTDWIPVPAESIAQLLAPSLAILREDAEAAGTPSKWYPDHVIPKWTRSAEKMNGELQTAEAFARDLGAAAIEAAVQKTEWRAGLSRSANGKPTTGPRNVAITLLAHPESSDLLHYDARGKRVVMLGAAPWDPTGPTERRAWTDADAVNAAAWIEAQAGFVPSPRLVQEVASAVARRRSFDPFVDYLEGLRWDGSPRLTHWLETYAGAEGNDFTRAVGPAWVISAVARAFVPGAKVDTMLILEGPQGAFKSTLLRALAGDAYFTDQLPDLASKDAKDTLQGPVIVELAELDALGAKDVSAIKAFLSITTDRFRAAYGRTTEDYPRRVVFAGTINPDGTGYLRDGTGARRFWCVLAGRCDVDAMRADRDQIWAEAVHRYRAGEPWWLDARIEAMAATEADARRDADPWEDTLGGLSEPLKIGADGRGFYRAHSFPAEDLDSSGRLVWITSTQALAIVGLEVAAQDRGRQMRIGRTLRALGWRRAQRGVRRERGFSIDHDTKKG